MKTLLKKYLESQNNSFSNTLFDMPMYLLNPLSASKVKLWFYNIAYKHHVRKYYKKIKNLASVLRNRTPSFNTLCEFADFIKHMEMVYQYKNFIDKESDKPQVLCDTDINDSNKKTLILFIPKRFTATFIMTEDSDGEWIKVKVENAFGKRLTTTFQINNKSFVYYDFTIYHNNLIYVVNHELQNAMADTFLECAKLVEPAAK